LDESIRHEDEFLLNEIREKEAEELAQANPSGWTGGSSEGSSELVDAGLQRLLDEAALDPGLFSFLDNTSV